MIYMFYMVKEIDGLCRRQRTAQVSGCGGMNMEAEARLTYYAARNILRA